MRGRTVYQGVEPGGQLFKRDSLVLQEQRKREERCRTVWVITFVQCAVAQIHCLHYIFRNTKGRRETSPPPPSPPPPPRRPRLPPLLPCPCRNLPRLSLHNWLLNSRRRLASAPRLQQHLAVDQRGGSVFLSARPDLRVRQHKAAAWKDPRSPMSQQKLECKEN